MTTQQKKLIKLIPSDTVASCSLPSPPKAVYDDFSTETTIKRVKPPSLKKKLQKKKEREDSPSYLTTSSSSSDEEEPKIRQEIERNFERNEKYKKEDSPIRQQKSRSPPSPLTEMTFTDTTTATQQSEEEINLFNSKKERNKFLSKILLKSKKKIYKLAGCFLTPFLLLKLIMPDLPFF